MPGFSTAPSMEITISVDTGEKRDVFFENPFSSRSLEIQETEISEKITPVKR